MQLLEPRLRAGELLGLLWVEELRLIGCCIKVGLQLPDAPVEPRVVGQRRGNPLANRGGRRRFCGRPGLLQRRGDTGRLGDEAPPCALRRGYLLLKGVQVAGALDAGLAVGLDPRHRLQASFLLNELCNQCVYAFLELFQLSGCRRLPLLHRPPCLPGCQQVQEILDAPSPRKPGVALD